MGPLDIINHLLNFAAPAMGVAALLAIFSRMFGKKATHSRTLGFQFAVNLALGLTALVAGLVVFGRDGKMLTYLALVLATGTGQWWQSGGARK